ncbi:MAG: threonine/serine exporter family protein [Propionibacteriales bacterium]|nr:threonine/serine exporter family protein [Propionibacteriales bacterium]
MARSFAYGVLPRHSQGVDEELRKIYQGLDLALRVGEVVLASGAGAADTTASMLAVTEAVGFRGCETDVSFTSLSVSYQPSPDDPPETRMRRVYHREFDYSRLTAVDHLVRDLVAGTINQDEARKRLDTYVSTGRPIPRWASTLGWGVMAAGVALLMGGTWVVMVVAFLATMLIDYLNRQLGRRRIPVFYQQVLGGFVATMAAVGMQALSDTLEFDFLASANSSQVVAAAIIVLLSGMGIVGAVQDALTGFYVTAAARSFEVVLLTGGIIGGVTGGLVLVSRFDVSLVVAPTDPRGIDYLPLAVLGAAITASAFVFASYAPFRTILPAALMGILGQVVYRAVVETGVGVAWGSALAAVLVGVTAFSVAGRMRVPPLVVVVSGIVPLLPGMSIYRGLYQMFDPESSTGAFLGMTSLVTAATIAVALAAGVILGEYVAQPLKREARRLETRLAGPRLVGPLRIKRSRRSRRRGPAPEGSGPT